MSDEMTVGEKILLGKIEELQGQIKAIKEKDEVPQSVAELMASIYTRPRKAKPIEEVLDARTEAMSGLYDHHSSPKRKKA